MRRKLTDFELNQVLSILGYPSNVIAWATEILQGRVDLDTIRYERLPVYRKHYALTDAQITEAASYAAMQQLRREIRDPYEPPDSSDRWDDEDSMTKVCRSYEREEA